MSKNTETNFDNISRFNVVPIYDKKRGVYWYLRTPDSLVDLKPYDLELSTREKASRGNIYAQYTLGCELKFKNQIPEAITWFRKAADQGHEESRRIIDEILNEVD